MTADDRDYLPVARTMIQRYGDGALDVLDTFVSAHREMGDRESVIMWQDIARAARRILRADHPDRVA